MLRDFVKQKHVDDGWFFDFDTKIWHQLPTLEIEPYGTSTSTDILAEAKMANERLHAKITELEASTNAPVEEVAADPVLPPAAPAPPPSSASTGAPRLVRRMVRQ
jgi:hypothetical protein